MDDGVGSDAAGDWGPNIDGGQGEKAGKIRAFSSSKRSPWTWAESWTCGCSNNLQHGSLRFISCVANE